MKVAVTGAAGRLGGELLRQDWRGHDVVGWTRKDADLGDEAATAALFARDRPACVVHTAAATDLVRAERERQWGWENVALPAIHVARECARHGARLVHVSTDYVFSGNEPEHPIPTWARPDPTHYYAVCKVAAESAARAVPDHCVVRLTLKARGPWRHAQAPDDMWISHSFYDEAVPFLRDVALSDRRGVVHFGVRDVNVYEHARETRPDVQRVKRAEIGTIALPGDIRLRRE